jgi:hypothetical protein
MYLKVFLKLKNPKNSLFWSNKKKKKIKRPKKTQKNPKKTTGLVFFLNPGFFQPCYQVANAGFSFDYQLLNVPDFNGVGESQPSPFFYQNLAEAEYVVAVYMYMRLIGRSFY